MSLAVIPTIAGLRAGLAHSRAAGRRIGLVPTMGALHEGHGRLIDRARAECHTVVVSIFLNPIQFNQQADLERYPRTFEADLDFCRARGADVVFAPDTAEMYPEPALAFVEVALITEHLCGRSRPGHFRGVTTVVAKLFHIVEPHAAYFGEKDAQQLAAIERMVRDLNFPLEIVPVPTVREADGLAMSSRNANLSPGERRLAPELFRALCEAREQVEAGADPGAILAAARERLEGQGIRVDYLEIVDPALMQPVARIEGPVRIAGAVWLGATRLIDNVLAVPGRSR